MPEINKEALAKAADAIKDGGLQMWPHKAAYAAIAAYLAAVSPDTKGEAVAWENIHTGDIRRGMPRDLSNYRPLKYLATSPPPTEPTEEQVEAAARAIFETWSASQYPVEPMTWEEALNVAQRPADFPKMANIVPLCRKEARAALSAARRVG